MSMKTEEQQVLDQSVVAAINLMAESLGKAVLDCRRSCINCIHFTEHQGEVCKLVQQRPPARVIAFGCPSFAEDPCPF